MSWPADPALAALLKTFLDGPLDDPSQARAQLETLLDHVNAIQTALAAVLNNGEPLLKSGGTVTAAVHGARAAMGAGVNIDLNLAEVYTKTVSGAAAFTVSNVPAAGSVACFILDLTNGGSAAVTWWAGVKWSLGASPSLTASGRDLLGFYTSDGGTTWSGVLVAGGVR